MSPFFGIEIESVGNDPESPLLDPLLEPLLEPLLDPLLDPLLEPLLEPLLDPLLPLLEPLELLEPPSPLPPLPLLLLHAMESGTTPSAKTNSERILRILISDSSSAAQGRAATREA
jgi:hypothetical protein